MEAKNRRTSVFFLKILTVYLFIQEWIDRRFYYYLCKAFKEPHPKNGFDYRTRHFLENIDAKETVADLGCGTGRLVSALQQNGVVAFGVDWKRPLLLDKNAWIQADLREDGVWKLLTDRGVSTITLSHVLEHIEDSRGFLKKLRRFKKVLICVPSEENWKYQTRKKLGLNPLTDDTHYREYTTGLLSAEAQEAGFTVNTIFFNSEGEIFAVLS